MGSPTLDYAGSIGFGDVGGDISHPHWKANTSIGYTKDAFSATFRWRYIDSMIHSDRVADRTATTPGVPAYNYFDIEAQYTFRNRYTLGAGVNNLTDENPPFVSGAPLTTDAAAYDVVGTTWYVSLKAKF